MHESATIHVSLKPEIIGHLGTLPITNTLLMTWIVVVLLALFGFWLGRSAKTIPGRIQTLVEWVFETVYDFIAETLGSRELARRFFPLLATLFLFIATANILEFIPGVGSLGVVRGDEFIPLLRSMNTDLNSTLALTIIAVLTIEVTGVAMLGFFTYAGKFINFSSPVNFIVGIIELVSEVSRLVSFSFRLFGNIFAGEVLLAVVGFFVPYIIPVPLMAFELFVGVIQGVVFAMLLLFFLKLAIVDPHEAH
jgi:F-type H+-transporting ATPase subunit a